MASGRGPLSRRAYQSRQTAGTWEEIWEAGNYYDRVSELLEDAQNFAIIVGWQIDSRLLMKRPYRPLPDHPALTEELHSETLKQKLLRLCEDRPNFHVYLLMWDFANFYLFEREPSQRRIWSNAHPRIHFVFDALHPLGGSHHEKLIIIDGRIALCGGIDLCDERWDSPQHLYTDPRRSLDKRREHHGPYHDLAVQVSGPSLCAEIQKHVEERWKRLSSIPFPSPLKQPHLTPIRSGPHQVYLSRTIATQGEGDQSGRLVREIEFMFRELIAQAQSRIIMEGQYYWSLLINDFLLEKIRQVGRRKTSFEIQIILSDPKNLKFMSQQMSTHQLCLLRDLETCAQENGVRLSIATPLAVPPDPTQLPRPVYVHSKLVIIDDRFVMIGSANLASRALRVDTEFCLTLEATHSHERRQIQRLTETVFHHWSIGRESHNGMQLIQLNAKQELKNWNQTHRIGQRIPWRLFFDPEIAWFYFLKRSLKKFMLRKLRFNQAAVPSNPTWALLVLLIGLGIGWGIGWIFGYSPLVINSSLCQSQTLQGDSAHGKAENSGSILQYSQGVQQREQEIPSLPHP